MLMKRMIELANLKFEEDQIISISFVGPRTIARINKKFLGHIGLTDVISFDYRESDNIYQDNEITSELIVSPDMALMEASKRRDSSFAYEMTLYLVHGILHIAGENDLSPKERTKMKRKEKQIIKKLQNEFSLESIFKKNNSKIDISNNNNQIKAQTIY